MSVGVIRLCCLVFVCAFLAAPVTASASEAGLLLEIPLPDPEELAPRVRNIVAPAIDYFDRVRAGLEGPELGQAYGRLGLVFQAFQMQQAASACYRNAVTLDPENAHWHYYLAVHHEEAGNLEEALASYKQALLLDSEYPNTLLRIGRVSLEAGKLEEADAAFQALLERHPRHTAGALAGLGTVALRERRLNEAVDLLNRALALQPEATQLHYRLAQAHRALGDTDKAREHLAQRGDRVVSAADPWIEIMKARARPPSYYVQQGNEAVTQGDTDRALQTFMLVLALDPENTEALTRMAVLMGFGERREEAENLIDQALALEPDHGLANSLKGALLASEKRLEEAQAHYFRAVNAEPGNIDFRLQFANGLMRLGDYEAASRQYAEAVASQPSHLNARYGHAVSLSASGRCEEAIRTIEHGVEVNPRVALTLNARARLYATCPGANDAQRKLALDDALLLYDQRPDGQFAETVAMAMAANGRFAEAMDYQGQAIFEAIKAGDTASQAALRANMQRYEAMMAADTAWPELVRN